MNTYPHRARMKALAREQLLGKYLSLAGAFFMIALLRNIIVVPSSLLSLPQPFSMITYYAADLAIDLFFAVFKAGTAFLFLSNACGNPVSISGVFAGFGLGPYKAISIWSIPALLLLIPTVIPDLILTWIMQKKGTDLILSLILWLLIIMPLSLLIQTIIKLPFSMVYYIMLDFPEMDASACRRASVKLMKGNYWNYFKIQLSFLPLYLLGIISFGIGLLYVLPYQEQTRANFYLELVRQKKNAQ